MRCLAQFRSMVSQPLPFLVTDQCRSPDSQLFATGNTPEARFQVLRESLWQPGAQSYFVDARKRNGNIKRGNCFLGRLVDDAEFFLVLKWISLEKWQFLCCQHFMPYFCQCQVLYRPHSQIGFLLERRFEQFCPFEGNACSARSLRKYSPMVIGLAGLSETDRQHSLKILLLSIETEVVGVVLVIPGLWIQQRDPTLGQQVDQRWDISIATKAVLSHRQILRSDVHLGITNVTGDRSQTGPEDARIAG